MIEAVDEDRLAGILSSIELKELELLSWGALDGRLSADELRELIRIAGGTDETASFIDELGSRGLIFELPDGGYRSRMAETVRDLALLRQTFAARPWWQSPELVLDFRIVHRPRRRPARTIPGNELVSIATKNYHQSAVGAVGAATPSSVATFQVRAAQSIREALRQADDSGVVISAGTGSGKTLGFYLPAIGWIFDSFVEDPRDFVRALAVYPRNELLKDQLKMMVSLIASVPSGHGTESRRLRIGAWFGAVPTSAFAVKNGRSSWRVIGNKANPEGWECPYFDCPTCGSSLVWTRRDLDRGVEKLTCGEEGCGFELDADQVALTRNSAVARPPDIMFTTTESINRQLASAGSHPAFGLSGERRVRMVLLDEVHTYEGTTGAQSAYLLRRLRHAVGRRPLLWVGLSATLLDAGQFFADLAGVRVESVTVIEPTVDELEETGAEYMLALRHNPASHTGPLSVTIQTALALERFLDCPSEADRDPFGPPTLDSGGMFGSRSFVFTDKLDVTNRLYWDLLDAEGLWEVGRPIAQRIPSTLAHLRSARQQRLPAVLRDASGDRLASGQWWWMAERLGHDLDADQPIRVGRTSSQDQGVSDVDIVVATASLEVGYDDERVGAVIQHKAPHDAARFLQRKGRAGRSMSMRPWTVVVLSDWGRDRFAWQSYDQLFDPQLEASRLPVGNRYVQRMQAVYATFDWLSRQVQAAFPDRNVWADLAGPANVVEVNQRRAEARLSRQQQLERVIAEILDGGPARARLLDSLQRSLGLGADEIDALVWTPPRPLLLAVLPTAHRRLLSQWSGEEPAPSDRTVRTRTPLTEFVAGNLFDDLLAPEVELQLPTASGGSNEPIIETLPTFRVLREFLPGNVTRHFGIRSFSRRHWVEVPTQSANGTREATVDSYGGAFVRNVTLSDGEVSVFRPTRVVLTEPDEGVLDSSSMSPAWEVEMSALGLGAPLEVPPAWAEAIPGVVFHMHTDGDGARTCRFVRRALGSMRRRGGQAEGASVVFGAEGVPFGMAALGVEFDADAICITIAPPPITDDPGPIERSLRLGDLIENDPELSHLNWTVRRAFTSSTLLVLVEAGSAQAFVRMVDRDLASSLRRALYRLGLVDQMLGVDGLPVLKLGEDADDLYSLLDDGHLMGRLRDAVTSAGALSRDDAWQSWHRQRVATAFATAFVDASSQLVASFDPSDVAIDIVNDVAGAVTVWISEEGPGGNGQIESLYAALADSASEFWSLVFGRTAPSDLVLLDREVRAFIATATPGFGEAWDALRTSWRIGHESATSALESLRRAFNETGQADVSRQALGFVCMRLAGPGAPAAIPALVTGLIDRWTRLEEASGFAIDARLFGVTCDADGTLDEQLGMEELDERRRSRAVSGLFWPRSLDVWSSVELPGVRYGNAPSPAFDALGDLLPSPWPKTVCTGPVDARSAVESTLGVHGVSVLVLPDSKVARVVIRDLLEHPIEIGPLFVYPRVVSVGASASAVTLVLAAAELEL